MKNFLIKQIGDEPVLQVREISWRSSLKVYKA